MQIQQHIHFIDRPLECHRLDVRFPAPLDIGAVLGRDQPYYAEAKDLPPGTQSTLTKIPSVISGAGVLHVVETVGLGTVVSVELRQDHTLTNLIVPESAEVILLANEGYLVLWVVAGHSGILVLQAQVVKDKENTHGKIRRNLGDVPMRDYLT